MMRTPCSKFTRVTCVRAVVVRQACVIVVVLRTVELAVGVGVWVSVVTMRMGMPTG